MKFSVVLGLSLFVIVVVGPGEPTQAQVIITPGAVRISASGGAAGFRAPGNMVADGIARAEASKPEPLAIIPITAVETTSLRAQTISQSLSIVFSALNLAIIDFHNKLLARAGSSRQVSLAGALVTPSSGGDGLSSLIDQVSSFLPGGSGR